MSHVELRAYMPLARSLGLGAKRYSQDIVESFFFISKRKVKKWNRLILLNAHVVIIYQFPNILALVFWYCLLVRLAYNSLLPK